MKYGLVGLIALAAAGSAHAEALVCTGLFYTGDGDPQQTTFTVTLDREKNTARTSSDVGWVEGPLTLTPDRYTGELVAKSGAVRSLSLERYTGELLLSDKSRNRVIYTANCRKAEARF